MLMRVLLLNNVPAPYFTPLFGKLGRESGWELTVCYSSAWNRDVGWDEKEPDHGTIILDQRKPLLKSIFGNSTAAAAALAQFLIQHRLEYLICYGYTLKPQIIALMSAMLVGMPFAVVGDANIYCDNVSGAKRLFKRWWLRQITRRAAALITIGTANRMFWESYGAKSSQIFEARFAVDNDFYAQASEMRKADAGALRTTLGLTGKVVYLFVGRLVKRKNVDLIIRAVEQLNNNRIAVVIAGTGEAKEELESIANGNPSVIFAGAVTPEDLPIYYAMSDVIVLPASQEPWGLVVNEAMACGLAVIAHRHCGATIDLVNNDNGFTLDNFTVEELAGAMKLIADDDGLRHSMQKSSTEKIKSWSIDAAVRGIINAVESSVNRRRAHLADRALREEK